MGSEHYAIIGRGSVAAAAGWLLGAGGLPFFFVGRTGPQAWSYSFEARGQTTRVNAALPSDLSSAEVLLVCVKAYDLAAAYAHLDLFKRGVVVVTFANGATADLITQEQKARPRHIFRPGFATLGVSRTGDDQFALRSRGGTFLFGPLDAEQQARTESEEMLLAMQPPAEDGPIFKWSDDIRTLQRRKWLYNTVINTLTAARRLETNGALLSDLPTLAAVFTEAYELAAQVWGPWGEAKQDLYEKMLRLIRDTQDNENSMAADVRLGRQTESDFLAGLSSRDPSRYPLLQELHLNISRFRKP